MLQQQKLSWIKFAMSSKKAYNQMLTPGTEWHGKRYIQCLMGFLGVAVAYSLRINLSVAIVPMTDRRGSSNKDYPVMDWDEPMKGTVFSSFFWGYILLQVPAGQLAENLGPKLLLVAALFTSGVVTVLTPYLTIHGGFYCMVLTRVIQGAVQGFLYPCENYLLSKWAPIQERNFLFTWVFSGGHFGTIVTMATAGILADSRGGWPSIFYVTGGVAILWALCFYYIGVNSPSDHSAISETEKNYILNSLSIDSSERKSLKTPWRDIATSGPLWAILIAHCCQNWGFWTLLTQTPSYLNAVFNLNIKKSGYLSALPYVSCLVMGFVFAFIGDSMYNKGIMSKTATKKFWNSVAFWGPACTLVVMSYAASTSTVAVGLLAIGMAMNSAVSIGYLSNHLALSPNFAGTLMGITNGFSNITSISAPLFVGFIVTNTESILQWRIVFLTSSAILFIGNLIFLLFGSGEVQHWNSPKSITEDEDP